MTLSHDDRMLLISALNTYSDQFRADASREYSYMDSEPSKAEAHKRQAEILLSYALKCIVLRNRITQEGE